jgi:cobalt/nickel transport system permease protein
VAHIPDGFLSVPVLAGTAAASAVALTAAARHSRSTLGEREGPVLGATTAFVFAAQTLNFPLGIGASAHLLGGTLVALLLGPWAGMLVLFAVLLVQALLFQDGGIAALGANTLNMAVLGVGSAWAIIRLGRRILGDGRRGLIASAGVAAWTSTTLVGLAVAAELTLSGLTPFRSAALLVGGGHAIVGVAEAVLTTLVVGAVLRVRPELLTRGGAAQQGTGAIVLGLGTAAVVVGLVAILAASRQPDALQAALGRLGLQVGAPSAPTPFAGYTAPVGGAWVAVAIGLLATFLVAWGVTITLRRRRL